MITVRSASVSNAKRAFSGFFNAGDRHSGGFVTLSYSLSIVSTQLIISSSLISSLILVICIGNRMNARAFRD